MAQQGDEWVDFGKETKETGIWITHKDGKSERHPGPNRDEGPPNWPAAVIEGLLWLVVLIFFSLIIMGALILDDYGLLPSDLKILLLRKLR